MTLTILQGDVFEQIATLPDASIDLCITSPPYWGLRSYGAGEKELGNEPTMEAYLENTLRWVREVWRVLKPRGSFVLNIGDCFLGKGRGNYNPEEGATSKLKQSSAHTKGSDFIYAAPYFKPKQLLSVSSFLYCKIVSETDFVCRGEHIWAKPNVPSPIRTRLKHSHEKVFWFVKDADKNYFDEKPWLKTIRDQSVATVGRNSNTTPSFADNVGLSESTSFRRKAQKAVIKERNNAYGDDQSATPGKSGCGMTNTTTIEHSWRIVPVGAKQNGFELAGKKASEHVAPYPEELIRPYIKSLCPSGGTILDPFLGSGTTMRVAMEEQRSCVGIELNPASVAYAKKRVNFGQGLGKYAEAMA